MKGHTSLPFVFLLAFSFSSLLVAQNQTIIIDWTPGAFADEPGYEIISSSNGVVACEASGGSVPVDDTLSISPGTYTVLGYDSFGDGWNGATLGVFQEGQNLGEFELSSGGTDNSCNGSSNGGTVLGTFEVLDLTNFEDDTGVTGVDPNGNICKGGEQEVEVVVQNFGNNVVNEVTVNWAVNGQLQTPILWNSPIDAAGGNSDTAQVNLGTYEFSYDSIVFNIEAWTSQPNGNLDPNPVNDSISFFEIVWGVYPFADTVEFDVVYQSETLVDSVFLITFACDTAKITNVSTSNPAITMNIDSGDSLIYYVGAFTLFSFPLSYTPSSSGFFLDSIVIETDKNPVTIYVQSNVIDTNDVVISPDTLVANIPDCLDSVEVAFEIENKSNTDLPLFLSDGSIYAFEDFEAPFLDWILEGSWGSDSDSYQGSFSLSDSPSGEYANNWDFSALLSRQFTIVNAESAQVNYFVKYELETNYDYAYLEMRINQGNWSGLATYNGTSDWIFETIDLSSLVSDGDEVQFRVRINTDFSITRDGIFLDDFSFDQNLISKVGSPIDTLPAGTDNSFEWILESGGLTQGTYNTQIIIYNSVTGNPVFSIPAQVNVLGEENLLVSSDTLLFDTLQAGNSAIDSIELINGGCDTLTITQASIQGDNAFGLTEPYSNIDLLPGESVYIKLSFTPPGSSGYSAELLISNSANDTTVTLLGSGAGTPQISFSPDSINTQITCGAMQTLTFSISNSGDAPLEWNTPGEFVLLQDSFESALNATFWDLGATQNEIINGTCGANSGNNAIYFTGLGGSRILQTNGLNTLAGGTISFFLKYGSGDAPCEEVDSGEEVVLEYSIDNGTNWILIEEFAINEYLSFSQASLAIPPAAKSENTIFRWLQKSFSTPGPFDNWAVDDVLVTSFPVSVIPDAGTVDPGTSASIQVEIDAASLNAGVFQASLPFNTNIQSNPVALLPFDITVTGAPVPNLSDNVFVNLILDPCDTTTDSVWISNTGCSLLVIDSLVTNTDGPLSWFLNDFTISPGDSTLLQVEFMPQGPGNFADVLNIYSNGGSEFVLFNNIVNYEPLSIAVSNGDSILCEGETATLSALPGDNVTWSTGASGASISVSGPGVYFAVRDISGCKDTSDFLILSSSTTTTITASDTEICSGESLLLTALNVESAVWSTGQTGSIINVSPTQTTTYWVEGTNEDGCTSSDTISIQVNAGTDTTFTTSTTCQLSQSGIFVNTYTSQSGCDSVVVDTVEFLPGSSTVLTQFTCDPEEAGQLIETYPAQNGCDSAVITNTILHPLLNISITPDQAICAGEGVPLFISGGGDSFQWLPAAGLSDPIIPNPIAIPDTTTTYTVTVTDSNGCTYEESVEIIVSPDAPLAQPMDLIPADGAVNYGKTVQFSWMPVPDAIEYDVFIWQAGTPKPSFPTISGTEQINFTNNNFNFGQSYNWQVVSKNVCTETEGPVQSFMILDLPDLIAGNVFAPSSATAGTNISIDWTVTNLGGSETGPVLWADGIYLSSNTTLDGGDTYLGSFVNFSGLNVGASYTQQNKMVQLPQYIEGQYYIIVVANLFGYILEDDFMNNDAVRILPINISLPPLPDLEVTSFSVNPLTAFFDGTITVNWEVTNQGAAQTPINFWRDRVFLSDQPTFDINTVLLLKNFNRTSSLGVGESYSETYTIQLPELLDGENPYYIYVLSDAGLQMFEETETNNLESIPLDLFLPPFPDFVVNNVSASDTVSSGATVSMQWTIENLGSAPNPKSWRDYIYFSTQPNDLDLSHADFIKANTSNAVLQPDSSVTLTASVKIPDDLSAGNYYWYVRTDATNQINEYTQEDNNVGGGAAFTVLNPDLSIASLSLPDTVQAGQSSLFSATLLNIGQGDLSSSLWKSQLRFSTTIDDFNSNLVGEITFDDGQAVTSGGQAFIQDLIKWSDNTSGKYYYRFDLDFTDQIQEENEGNNTLTDSLFMLPAPPTPPDTTAPDLAALPLVVPDTAIAGESISISYSVQNIGNEAIQNQSWQDYLYLSDTSILTPEASLLKVVNKNQSLNPGGTYTGQVNISLAPLLEGGTYYLFAVVDYLQEVSGDTLRGNNIVSKTLIVEGYPPVDLDVTAANVSVGNIGSGQSLQVEWLVKNQGPVSTPALFWEDAVFLSSDPVWDPADMELGTQVRFGALSAGDTYFAESDISIPNGLSGPYYLIAVADKEGINPDFDTTNNFRVVQIGTQTDTTPITVTPTPPPDLELTWLNPSIQLTAGQPFEVVYKVENNGVGPVEGANWLDFLLLSTDQTPGENDLALGSLLKNQVLEVGESYMDTLSVTIPITYTGNYLLILLTDAGDQVYENNQEANNVIANPVLVNQAAPADLVISDVTAPSTAASGEEVTVSWVLNNQGLNAALGSMQTAVYLSKDTIRDAEDIVFGTSATFLNLGPDEEIFQSLTAPLNSVSMKGYYLLVEADISNNINESADTNNTGISDDLLLPIVPELPLDTLLEDSLKTLTPIYYRIEIPDSLVGETLQCSLFGDSVNNAVNELYLRYEDAPTRNMYDFQYQDGLAANQTLAVPSLQAGTYYLLAYPGSQPGMFQQVHLLAEILPFEIRTVDAAQGGNTGSVTIKLTGSRFEEGMQARLLGPDTIFAHQLYFLDDFTVFASFDLDGAPLGMYDVELTKDNGDEAEKALAFEVIAGVQLTDSGNGGFPPGLSCTLETVDPGYGLEVDPDYPLFVRPNRLVLIKIRYKNNGTNDIPVPVYRITSDPEEGAPIATDEEGLEEENNEQTLEFKEENGPPGVLRPGGEGEKRIYSRSIGTLRFKLFR